MFGDNPIRPPLSHDGSTLEVKSIFATIQGEGPYVGWPSIFLRLGGCNLACNFCDTDFEQYETVAIEAITQRIESLARDAEGNRTRSLVVITGGEPLRQNIVPICEMLIAQGFKIQIETNGTLWRPLPKDVHIVCSPKNTGQGYFPLRQDMLVRANALKFIISKGNAHYNHVAELGQNTYNTPVYIQPMDEYNDMLNADNLAFTLALAKQHGYRLSLQTHKLVGIE